MKKLFVVTGASGLLGNNLVKKLLNLHEKVRVLLLPNEKIQNLDPNKIEIVYGDVRNIDSLKPLFKKEENQEIVFIHSAGIITISNKNDDNVYNVNVNGTRNIVELCKNNKVNKFIYINSVHAIEE